MATCIPQNTFAKKPHKLSVKLESIQDELARFSEIAYQLSTLSDEQLAEIDVSKELDTIKRDLHQFEVRCLSFKEAFSTNGFSSSITEETEFIYLQPASELSKARNETKRAKKIANQLFVSLRKIHTSLDECEGPIEGSEDLDQLNQVLANIAIGF